MPDVVADTAHLRIAPTAMRTRLVLIPMGASVSVSPQSSQIVTSETFSTCLRAALALHTGLARVGAEAREALAIGLDQSRADCAGVPVTRRTTCEVTANSPPASAS